MFENITISVFCAGLLSLTKIETILNIMYNWNKGILYKY